MTKKSTSTTWFFREGMITASVVHEVLPKLNSKNPLHKNKAQPIFVQRYPYLYLGASPEGVISCNSCGKRILEIKYPCTSQEKLISEYVI